MKSTVFRKVLNEEYIEVNKSVSETIKCLCEQSGGSYNETPDGMNIHFECLKNGKCYVRCGSNEGRSTKSMYQMYYVYGEVVSKDDKTFVKITSVYEKADFWMRIISTVLAFLFLPVIFNISIHTRAIFSSCRISRICGFNCFSDRFNSLNIHTEESPFGNYRNS